MDITEAAYFVLASLQDGPLHGYGIIKHAERISAGRVKLAAGTLYGVIDRLVTHELIVSIGEEIVDGRARRSYQLTSNGLAALRDEAGRLTRAASVVHARARRGAIAVRLA